MSGEGDSSEKKALEARFAPYVRVSPPWTTYEVVKTAVMSVLVLPFRIVFLFVMLAVLWIIARLTLLGVSDFEEYRYKPLPAWRRRLTKMLGPIARLTIAVSFGIWKIETVKQPEEKRAASKGPGKAFVVVSNHLGYLDIAVLFVKYHGSFVAKGDIAKTRFIGTIATAIQCLFVDEARGGLTTQLIDRVEKTYTCHAEEDCLGCGTCLNTLVIFPEGTTTNGTAMVRFRTGVFNAGLPVWPIAVRFAHKHFNPSWETILFKEHIWRTMTQFVNNVELIECPVYEPSAEEKQDSKLYSKNVQTVLAGALDQVVYPLNRKHKFAYHSYLLGKQSADEALAKADEITADDNLLDGEPSLPGVEEMC